jgi:Zn-finger nucleic acid-binding protein
MNCPGCGAAMEPVGNRNYFRCTHCDSYHFPEETGDRVAVVGEDTGALCPLCRVPLVSAHIDGETVCSCEHCRGFLAETSTFGLIVAKRRARHGPDASQPAPFDPAELRRVLTCPNCQRRMDAHPYLGGGNAVVDTCEGCGLIWLDAGELAVIARYVPHVPQIEPALTLPGSGRAARSEAAQGGLLVDWLFGDVDAR